MARTAARAPRFVKSEFVVESTLLGQSGASERFTAIVVPPSAEPTIARHRPPTLRKISAPFAARSGIRAADW
jgi:hypothetical protein